MVGFLFSLAKVLISSQREIIGKRGKIRKPKKNKKRTTTVQESTIKLSRYQGATRQFW